MHRRVLVADSEGSLAMVYECYLESHGFDVALAMDGIDCLEQLQEYRLDVLLLDAELLWGGADGVLAYLRSGEGFPSTSVILVADVPPDEAAELIVQPVQAVLQKPFRLRSLLTLLRTPAHDLSRSRQTLAAPADVQTLADQPAVGASATNTPSARIAAPFAAY